MPRDSEGCPCQNAWQRRHAICILSADVIQNIWDFMLQLST